MQHIKLQYLKGFFILSDCSKMTSRKRNKDKEAAFKIEPDRFRANILQEFLTSVREAKWPRSIFSVLFFKAAARQWLCSWTTFPTILFQKQHLPRCVWGKPKERSGKWQSAAMPGIIMQSSGSSHTSQHKLPATASPQGESWGKMSQAEQGKARFSGRTARASSKGKG